MSAEENKTLVRRYIELLNSGNLDAVGELFTSDYVRHDPNAPEVRGPEVERQLVAMYAKNVAAFPDLRITVEDLIAEGDRVVCRLTVRGTQRGELMGIPPSGRQVEVAAMEIYRIAGGRIAEQWVVSNALGMLQQLGAIPAPPPPRS